MKVSEAIDRLKVGDTVWIKGKILDKDTTEQPLYVDFGMVGSLWLYKENEISLTEPQAEKVEVPDFVAEWLENHPDAKELSSKFNWWNLSAVCGGYISDPEYIFASWFNDKANSYGNRRTLLKAILDGYTVKPKRWVVRQGGSEVWCLQGFRNSLDGDIVKQWCSHEGCIKFTDKAKAAAVAVLVEGTVEEV